MWGRAVTPPPRLVAGRMRRAVPSPMSPNRTVRSKIQDIGPVDNDTVLGWPASRPGPGPDALGTFADSVLDRRKVLDIFRGTQQIQQLIVPIARSTSPLRS
ncbi:hypothetical protein GCM10012275_62210 [Longimycelium tulufanense]|uniref:Uncharacterized protein n=1 Tax=Longimycelium tulufanense TaxID=907463 RepID=A0A8J3FZB5_9PSEU|nr:hypothetical protein GCM10012275_62210 [Longimycelium tulufanense]